ncbi:hypothetical protein GGR51DRAFT_546936 [Nemania sp. FL0031]|nr:hypothetical protein GGR51DRAFT_546936 [Nemania sp. FL0031]
MNDIDTIAYLYPAVSPQGWTNSSWIIDENSNSPRYIPGKLKRSPSAVAWPIGSNVLDYQACLKIDLSQIPKTSLGLVAGCDPQADIVLPQEPGISFHHFSLTFDSDYRLIVRDLGSRTGTSVIYGLQDAGPRSNFQWIIGGDKNLKDQGSIIIKPVEDVQFKIITNEYNIDSKAFQAKVDKFRAGTSNLEDTLEDLAFRPPTQLPTGTHTPAEKEVFLKRKIGEGGFAVVYHAWNVRTGDVSALKEPLGELSKSHVKAWKNEALLMGRVSHDHIVKLLRSETGPPPSLHFEYLAGGSLRQHLREGKYFTGVECNHILKQSLSALAYLHELEPSITHRDLSDGNILVQARSADRIFIKLGDFGISKEGPKLNTLVGTPYFLPPEFFSETVVSVSLAGAKYTSAIDIWTLAAVIAKLLCGRPKHIDEYDNDGKLLCKDIRRRVEKFFRMTEDPLAQYLLDTMLCIKPEMRKSARECYDRSLQLPNGCRHTWKKRVLGFTSCEKEDEWQDEDEQDMEQEEEESEEEGSEEGETTIVDPRRAIVDGGVGGVPADLGTNDDKISPDQPGSHLSEGWSVTASVRELYRSGAPPPSTLGSHHTELREILGKISNPEDSLFIKSDISDESQFSDDAESNSRTVTPSTSALIPRNQHASAVVPRKRKIAAAPPAQASQALDASELVAKLTSISAREYEHPPSRSATQSPDPEMPKQHEIRCYHWLISAGGRPLCSLETLEDMLKNPDAYLETLRPWRGDVVVADPIGRGVFSRQLERWKEFRRWQRDNRGGGPLAEESFASFLDEHRRYFESRGAVGILTSPNFENVARRRWEAEKFRWEDQGKRFREVRQGNFTEYAEAARRRLPRHGFTQSFQLLEDPKQQDEYVTWIEYLEFECWWLDELANSVSYYKKQLEGGGKEKPWKLKGAETEEANQRLRVQWVLSKMPEAEEALNTTAAALDRETRATRKRRRSDNEDEGTGETTHKSRGAAIKRQKQGELGERDERYTARHTVGRKGSRMLLGLDTPVARTRVPRKDGVRRSARIKMGKSEQKQ